MRMADENPDLLICGGGPAGMMAGLLFARAGVNTLVLEKHGDFLRDFRGDTVHPSTLELMDASAERVRDRHSYNLAGISLTPLQIAAAIRRRIPGFTMDCVPDFRQAIAASWPRSIDDLEAREHWGWQPRYDLGAMDDAMLDNLRPLLTRAA